jgi:hypothetical protein
MSLSTLIGASMLAVFTWRVFRPVERWGVVAFGCILAGLVAGYGSAALAGVAGSPRAWSLLGVGVAFKIATYAWAVAKRRASTSPRDAAARSGSPLRSSPNRMLLWSIGLGAVLAIWIHEAITMATGPTPASFVVVAVFGFVCAVRCGSRSSRRRSTAGGSRSERRDMAATTAAFDKVCDELEMRTSLDRMQCRGTVRLALKDAGLEAARVQPREMQVVLQRVLPGALETRGVEGAAAICEHIARGIAALAPSAEPDSPDAIFRRLGG